MRFQESFCCALSRARNAALALESAAHKVKGDVLCHSHHHFCAEPNVALVVPGEGCALNVWESAQVPFWHHSAYMPSDRLAASHGCGDCGQQPVRWRWLRRESLPLRARGHDRSGLRDEVQAADQRRAQLNQDTIMPGRGGSRFLSPTRRALVLQGSRWRREKFRGRWLARRLRQLVAAAIANRITLQQIYGIFNLGFDLWARGADCVPNTAARGAGEPRA